MVRVSKYDDFRKINSIFFREHEKIIKKYNIDFISIRSTKIPLIYLYEIVSTLFENNSIILKISDIILLSLSAIGFLSKENNDDIKILFNELKTKKLFGHFIMVKNTIKSLKNLLNIILKKEGLVIQNIEQGLKYRYSTDVLNIAHTYIKLNNIKIKDFCLWYIVDKRNKESKDLIDYININYYL